MRKIKVITKRRTELQEEEKELKATRAAKEKAKTPEAKKEKKATDKKRIKLMNVAEVYGIEVTDSMTNEQIQKAIAKAMLS